MQVTDHPARRRRAKGPLDLYAGVSNEETKQFAPDITGGTKDRSANHAASMQFDAYLCNMRYGRDGWKVAMRTDDMIRVDLYSPKASNP
jgi:hypothetical protein